MKPLTDHEYAVKHKGQQCPACGSQEIEAERLDSDTLDPTYTVISITVNCNACGASWDDLYRLEGYQGLNDEDGNDIPAAELEAAAEGFHEFLLDDLVHDMKSEEATAINNRGSRAQLEYLLASGMTLEQIKERVAPYRLTPEGVENLRKRIEERETKS